MNPQFKSLLNYDRTKSKNVIKLTTIFSRIMNVGEVKRQSIVSFLLQIVYTVIGFLSTIYFAHVVGASVLGAYFLFLAYYGIIDMVIGGLSEAAVKRISEGEERNQYFSTSLSCNHC